MGWLLISGILIIPIGMALRTLQLQRRLKKELYDSQCPLCSTHFSDTMPRVVGSITPEQAQRLDKFQRRFAGQAVECCACGGIVLCSREGFPMRGYYDKEAVQP